MSTSNNDTGNFFERDIILSPAYSYNIQLKLYDIFIPALAIIIITINLIIVFSSGLILKKSKYILILIL